jgi:hypothetical protein
LSILLALSSVVCVTIPHAVLVIVTVRFIVPSVAGLMGALNCHP